jgi:hypothetical protein
MKKKIVYLLFLFAVLGIFAEEPETMKKTLIMGWAFAEEDSRLQTNLAVNAALKYAEAALYQMSSYEKYDSSCQIELYREMYDYENFTGGVYVYIVSGNEKDYHNRYIEINFYTVENGSSTKYKLALYYNDYSRMKNDPEMDGWNLISSDIPAYKFFVHEIKRFER